MALAAPPYFDRQGRQGRQEERQDRASGSGLAGLVSIPWRTWRPWRSKAHVPACAGERECLLGRDAAVFAVGVDDVVGQAAGDFGHVVEGELEEPRPCDSERSSPIRRTALGLRQVGLDGVPARQPSRGPKPSTWPRLAESIEVTPEVQWSGTWMVSRSIGSSRCGAHWRRPSSIGEPPGQAEGHFGGVDGVVAAVDQGHRHVDDREAQRPLGHAVAHALLDRRDPLPGHHAAGDPLAEREALAARSAA